MKTRAIRKWGALALALTTLGAACSYEALTVADTDAVLTIKDGGRDYTKYQTYALTDRVIDLCGILEGDNTSAGGAGGAGGRSGLDVGQGCFQTEHDYDADILEAIAKQMDAYGYERVIGLDQDPDVVLLVGSIARDNWQYQPAYVWCDPYFGFSCWYPSGGYVYNLPTGAVLINMIDRVASKTDDLKSVWFASLQGLYADSSADSTKDRIATSVQNAFLQSPYLKVGGAK